MCERASVWAILLVPDTPSASTLDVVNSSVPCHSSQEQHHGSSDGFPSSSTVSSTFLFLLLPSEDKWRTSLWEDSHQVVTYQVTNGCNKWWLTLKYFISVSLTLILLAFPWFWNFLTSNFIKCHDSPKVCQWAYYLLKIQLGQGNIQPNIWLLSKSCAHYLQCVSLWLMVFALSLNWHVAMKSSVKF